MTTRIRTTASIFCRSRPFDHPTSTLLTKPRPSCRPTSLFLQLPPSYRAFHASPKPQFVSELLTSTHDILNGIHSLTSLSWALTLPLSALLIRLALTLPLAIYTRRANQLQLNLQPLLLAWKHQIRRSTMATSGNRGPIIVERDVRKALRIKRRELYSRWKCGFWKNYIPIVQVPIWLLMIETIRGMCGTSKGLLGIIFTRTPSNPSNPDLSASASPTAGDWPQGLLPEAANTIPESIAATPALPSAFEPSLATEGTLWFPDLTASDPLLILPFMLSATMFLNIYSNGRRGFGLADMTPTRRRITRALALVALAAGPLTLQMPTAMLLYWVSSSLLAYGQNILLDVFMPLKMPVKPCKPKGLISKEEQFKG